MSNQRPPEEDRRIPLSPPDSRRVATGTGPTRTAVLFILGCFFFLLASGAAVLYLLPGTPTSTTQSNIPAERETAAESKTTIVLPAAVSDSDRAAAELLLESLLQLKIQAEAAGISNWAPEPYQRILAIAKQADTLSEERRFRDAADSYRLAEAELNTLLSSRQELYQSLLGEAQQALAQGQVQKATLLYERALAVNPSSEDARLGRKQALAREEVLALYRQAEELESAGNLSAAADKLADLLQQDNTYQPALTYLLRLEDALAEVAFNRDLSRFYEQIESASLTEARATLASVKRLKPQHPQVQQAEAILADKQEAAIITAKRKQAEASAKAEQWQDALTLYLDIIALAPEALFAVNGKEQALRRVELDRKMTDVLGQPDRLQDRVQREAAAELLRYAATFASEGERLKAQIRDLQRLLAEANSEVSITLESDNMTEITIYHIGRLGRFFSKAIILTPGTYTIVGSRVGYRDTRRIITINRASAAKSFSIICSETI